LKYLNTEKKWFADGHKALNAHDEEWGWIEGLDYFVFAGATSTKQRTRQQERFNNANDLRFLKCLI
jgi:hypothetical protein